MCHPYTFLTRTRTRPASHTLARYLLPAALAALLINLPKVLEVELVFPSRQEELLAEVPGLEALGRTSYQFTALRNNPAYVRYTLNSSYF